MRTKHWLIGFAFAIGLSAIAYAQVATSNLAGTEFFNGQAGSIGGGGIVVPTYVLRSGENHLLVLGGTTVNTSATNVYGKYLATGAITTWNFTLPQTPYTGQKVEINCPGGTVSTLTISANSPAGVSIVGTNPTSCTSGGAIANGVGFTYNTSNNIWYRYE